MKVVLLTAGCILLCIQTSEGFRGAQVSLGRASGAYRNRNPYGGGRRNRWNVETGGRQMGGMGFGKRSPDYYNTDDEDDEFEYEDEDSVVNYLQRLEEYVRLMNEAKDEEEKRGMASLARLSSQSNPDEKRSLSSMRGFSSNKRGMFMGSSLRGLKGKRGSNSPLALFGQSQNSKRGALSSLRSQGFTKYNI